MGTEIYTVGGTVQANAQGLYIPRQADQDLLQLCRDSTFAYVLTPRQMGKSSLMMRTAETLYEEGIAAVIIDLTTIGTQLTADQWYLGLLTEIADQLVLSVNVYQWWQARQHLGGTQRLSHFFEQVVIPETTDPVVIFIDEIDTTLTLGFADDFYAAIRGLYVARAKQPVLHRLSFVLIGVATPSDLIKDAKRTPFNVGERVELTDFTQAEVLPMATGLGLESQQAEQVLGWVLKWTGGHPYLTQRLCKALVDEGKQDWQESDVDRIVRRTFLAEESEKDNNLQFVRDMLTKRAPEDLEEEVLKSYRVKVLKTYREVQSDKSPVKDEEQSLVISHLKLAGVVRKEGELLKNRNLIYITVFDRRWIQQHLPESLWQKLKPAMPLIAFLSTVSVAVSGLAVYAINQRNEARLAKSEAQKSEVRAEQKANDEEYAKKQTEIALEQSRRNEKAAKNAAREAQRQKKFAQKSALLAKRRLQQVNSARKAEVIAREKAQKAQNLTERLLTEAEFQKSFAITQSEIANQERAEAEKATKIAKYQTGLAEMRQHNAELLAAALNAEKLFGSGLEIASLVESLKVAQKLKDLIELKQVQPRVRIQSIAILKNIVYGIKEQNQLTGHRVGVRSVTFSPDGQTLASGSADGTVKLWDRQGKELASFTGTGYGTSINSVVFSPDGQTLASGGWFGTVKLWDRQGKELASFKGHGNSVMSVVFSPDGQTLASGSRDGTVKLWNRKGKELASFTGHFTGRSWLHSNVVNSVVFSPDGQTLASGSSDGTVKLWDRQGKELASFTKRGASINSVVFSPDGQTLASGSTDGTVKLWNRQGKELASFTGHGDAVMSVVFSPDGQTLASGSRDDTVKLWDRQGKELVSFTERGDSVMSVAFNPDGQTLASGGIRGVVKLWDRQGKELASFKGHGNSVSFVAFSSDGQTLASRSTDGIVKLWGRQGKELASFTGGRAKSVAFSPDGQTLAFEDSEGTMKLWDRQGKELASFNGHGNLGMSVVFSPDGQTLASGSHYGSVKLWDRQGKELVSFKGHGNSVNSVAFSPDGQTLASGSVDGTVKLWGRQGKELASFNGHGNSVNSVVFSPDGQTLASGSRDGTVKLWNRQGKELASFKGHGDSVMSVAFNPDGQTLVSGSTDGTVKLWDRQGKELASFTGHSSSVNSVAFSSDGQTLVSGSDDRTVKLWNMDLEHLRELGCQWLGNYFANNPTGQKQREVCNGVTGSSQLQDSQAKFFSVHQIPFQLAMQLQNLPMHITESYRNLETSLKLLEFPHSKS